jgi:uncharacterized protein (TIGR03437 family)
MRVVCFVLLIGSLQAATFGRVVPLLGGGSDIVLDESHNRLYLPSSATNQVQVYSLAQSKFLAAISTDTEPIAAAISRSGQFLYVTCYADSVVDVIDLTALTVTNRISLPSKPQGIAVASDERVLISTVGTTSTVAGVTSILNVLLLYDPTPNSATPLTALSQTPVPAVAPTFPAPSSRAFLAAHSQLRATRNGAFIVGLNVTNAASGVGAVFVYQAASGTVLRARTLTTGFLSALAISDDGTRILCGANLFDASTLQLLGTLNTANATFPITPTTAASGFITQANQGGAAFAPSGTTLYTAYNVDPVNSQGGNIGQLLMADPDNLLIAMGIQMPEFLAGKMVVSADGSNAYALSDSGFVALPLSTISQSALAEPATDVLLLANDQCGVSTTSTSAVAINNPGRTKATVNATLLQYAGVSGQASPSTEPSVRSSASGLSFAYNSSLTRGYGTINPPHDFLLQSTEAINIPDRVRVYQNFRDSDDRGTILPISTGISSSPQLTDLVYDAARQRLYIANTGLNRVEVYDIGTQQFLTPIKVGQLPVSLALTPDGNTLYVANSGGESISIVDPVKMASTGLVLYPPIQFASNLAPILPSVIAAGVSGLQILMTNGQLWKVVGNTTLPRGVSTIIGSNAATGAANTIPMPAVMATSPEGRYILLASNNGFVYLYDADVDDFVAGRQIFTRQPTGYDGPIAAGPNGQYFVVDGMLLNQALVQVGSSSGLISAVSPIGPSSYAIYSTPASAANVLPTTQPTVQVLNASNGNPSLQIPALEGPITQVTATGSATIAGRTMAVNSTATVAYVITSSGLSIINLSPVPPSSRPVPNQKGTVNLGSYQTAIAPNGLISIFGQNLATSAVAANTPLPLVLGGSCVTLNNVALPLFMASPTQINAQVPPGTAAGNFPLVVRSIANQAASASQQVSISKYAPAVLVDPTGQILLYHADGSYVSKQNPANRDEPLVMYAVGLGATTGGAVTAGTPSPAKPLAVSPTAAVYFGDPSWVQAAIIVDFAGLAPGMIGIYQLNLRVPGFHISGDALLVTITAGGVSSPSTGPVVPQVSVN